MRIVIDMQGAQSESRFRGIGRYTLSLALAIAKNPRKHEIILALSDAFPGTIEPIRSAFDGILPQDNIRVWTAPGPLRGCDPADRERRAIAELLREAFLSSVQADVVLVGSLFEGWGDDSITSVGVLDKKTPIVPIVYDFIPLMNPKIYLSDRSGFKNFYEEKLNYLHNCPHILTISESSRQEALEFLNIDAEQVINISAACDQSFKIIDISSDDKAKIWARYGITRPFVMYTGGADERKNLPRLIQAYAGLPVAVRRAHQLVLVGKMPEGSVSELREINKTNQLAVDECIFTGFVEDEELVALYNTSKLFVFPSLHEGFGIPPLEAMRCGIPVIGANATSLVEVIGYPDALFDPLSVPAIRCKMERALTDDAFRRDLVEHGARHATAFSWDESARLALAALERVTKPVPWTGRSDPVDGAVGAVRRLLGRKAPLSVYGPIAAAVAINHPPGQGKRQLLIDISELVRFDARTGIQRVVRSILMELLLSPPEGYVVEPVYAVVGISGYRYAREFTARFLQQEDGGIQDEWVDAYRGDVFIGLDLQHHIVLSQQDHLMALKRRGVSVHFVVYDLLPVLLSGIFHESLPPLHHRWLEAISRFDGVVCISRAVADEYCTWLDEHGEKRGRPLAINWFHLGADLSAANPTKGLPDDAQSVLVGIKKNPSFLMVGTVEPRKGHALVLAAMEKLWAKGEEVNLVIIGKTGWMMEKLAERLRSHPRHGTRLFWLEGVSDEYLDAVYASSSCLMAASQGEGFGLPLIEAAWHKIPIIARDIPVFREVAGEHAYYFPDRDSPETLTESLESWLALYCYKKHPSSSGVQWLTWRESAGQMIDAVLGKRAYRKWMSGKKVDSKNFKKNIQEDVLHSHVGRKGA